MPMLQYMIILLDDTSVSFCHYDNPLTERRLIKFDHLKNGILWAMKENLNIQFVYPSYQIPEEYRRLIETVDHSKIGPYGLEEQLDVVVIDNFDVTFGNNSCYLWRCSLDEFENARVRIKEILPKVLRLNIVLTDIPTWHQSEFDKYKHTLDYLADAIAEDYKQGYSIQFNLLTDRLVLFEMNNCMAGDASITLAPNGMFYTCPAWYYSLPDESEGGLEGCLRVRNQQLYRLDHAPICRHCEAYQCKRCVWINKQTTKDVNTPSHEQCVAAHIERNASMRLQKRMQSQGVSLRDWHEINEIDYLDPYLKLEEWKQEKKWEK